MRVLLSIFVMLIVSPALAEAALVFLQPSTGDNGGFLSFFAFFILSLPLVFVTPQLWPTYFPAIIFTPLIMRRVAMLRAFKASKLPVILCVALLIGAAGGVVIMTWLIIITARNSWSDALSCAGAGAFSGSITLVIITLIYRYERHAA